MRYGGSDDPEQLTIVKTVRVNTNKPISVKVGVGSIDVVELARVAVDAGADIITAINTLRAMSIDIETMMPILSNRIGGLSGNAIKPIGIRCVYEISKKLEVPVIGWEVCPPGKMCRDMRLGHLLSK